MLCCRPSTIQQQEFTIPGAQDEPPAKVVIKTNPLFAGQDHRRQQVLSSEIDGSQTNQEVFYGQRRKIRKTKEQEMINAIVDLTNHGE